MTDIERNILLNQFAIMSALETIMAEKPKNCHESKQLKDRMSAITDIILHNKLTT